MAGPLRVLRRLHDVDVIVVFFVVMMVFPLAWCKRGDEMQRGGRGEADGDSGRRQDVARGKKFVLLLSDGVDPGELSDRIGGKLIGKVSDALGNYYEYEMPVGIDAGDIAERSRHGSLTTRSGVPAIVDVMQQESKKRYSRSLGTSPPPGSIDGAYDAIQWHLAGGNNADAHVLSAWNRGFFGQGSTVVIVDDGLDKGHPDIERSYSQGASANFNSGDPRDPGPVGNFAHGTAAAGVAVGSGKESPPRQPLCGHGVAPFAAAGGIRLISEPVSDSDEARALSFSMGTVDVYSCSWGPPDDGTILDAPGPLATAAIDAAANDGRRTGAGCAFVWAAGNGGSVYTGDTCGHDGYAGNQNVIAVGAISHSGVAASYSESCPSMFVCAPSSGDGWSIATSDVTGYRGATSTDCRNDFGGTSAAAPFVAGAIALLFSANPDLSSRDAYRILAATARVIDREDSSWKRNAAGVWHSDRYGFGLVDVDAAVVLGMDWSVDRRREEVEWSSSIPASACCIVDLPSMGCRVAGESIPYPCDIPDKSKGKNYAITSSVVVHPHEANPSSCRRSAERVIAIVTATHAKRGDLQFTLVSPSGSTSVFKGRSRDRGTSYSMWNFTSVSHWGEDPVGEWKLIVEDTVSGNRGKLEHFELHATGTSTCGR
jgi:kexin